MDDRLQIRLFGPVQVSRGGNTLVLPRGKPLALFALLIVFKQTPHTREQLAARLWPEAPSDRASAYLSNALYRLRRALGGAWLAADEFLQICTDTSMWVDLWEFERLALSPDLKDQAAAVALADGELAADVYDDWTRGPRLDVEERVGVLLDGLGATALTERRWADAEAWFRRRLRDAPLNEGAARGLMLALANRNQADAALRVYAALEASLFEEVQEAPEVETRRLADRLRAERTHLRAASPGRHFVGRTFERARLIDWLEQPESRLALVVGEAGIGKSRLLSELVESARVRGWQCHSGQATEFETPGSFAPLDEALRAALAPARWKQLERALPGPWLGVLQPWLARGARIEAARFDVDRTQERPGLAAAIARVLETLGRIHPQLIILEDIQWGDPGLWALLSAIRPLLPAAGARIALSTRSEDVLGQSGWDQALAWQRLGDPVLRLGGLSESEAAQLVGLGASPTGQPDNRLIAAGGGNPLFTLELAQARDAETLLANRPTLRQTLARRIQAVSPAAQDALGAAAVLGQRFDEAVWSAMLAAEYPSPNDRLDLLATLEQARLIVLETDGYRFDHDPLRACVYLDLPPVRRRDWHARALGILGADPDVPALVKLRHAEQSESHASAIDLALQAGEQALAALNPVSAVALFQRVAQAPSVSTSFAFRAFAGLARAHDILNDREAQHAAIDQLRALAARLASDEADAELAWQLTNLAWATGRFHDAVAHAEQGLEPARRVGDLRRSALLLEFQGRAARDLGDYLKAQAVLRAAQRLYEQIGDPRGHGWIEGQLGVIAQRQGRLANSAEHHTRAVQALRAAGDTYAESRAATGLAVLHWQCGDFARARSVFEEILSLSRINRDLRMEESCLHNLGALADILADYATALDLKTQALAASRAAGNAMGVALGLSNLAITLHKLGRHAEALTRFDEALEADQAMGRRQGEAYSWHGRGQVLFALGELSQARTAVQRAWQIRLELGERHLLADTAADLALIELADENLDQAQARAIAAAELLNPEDSADLRAHVCFARFRVLAAAGQDAEGLRSLAEADQAQIAFLATLPRDTQHALLERDPRHRAIRQAVAAHSQIVKVNLMNFGRASSARRRAEQISIVWTLTRPADLLLADRVERRRRVLQRLMREADEQGGTPTDADLARALGVTRRTVISDRAALTAGRPTT